MFDIVANNIVVLILVKIVVSENIDPYNFQKWFPELDSFFEWDPFKGNTILPIYYLNTLERNLTVEVILFQWSINLKTNKLIELEK